jgi:hypothetical protein
LPNTFVEDKSKDNMVDNYLAYVGEMVDPNKTSFSQPEWKDITKNII